MIAIPLEDLNLLLTAWRSDDRFNPYENYGFYYMFNAFAYPLIWTVTTSWSILAILLLPNLMFLYIVDRDLFVDWELTEAHTAAGEMYFVPRQGLPTAISQIYNIEALLWGDYTWLIDETKMRISFTTLA